MRWLGALRNFSLERDEELGGGGYGPDPVHVGPPRTTVREEMRCRLRVRTVLMFCSVGLCLVALLLVWIVYGVLLA